MDDVHLFVEFYRGVVGEGIETCSRNAASVFLPKKDTFAAIFTALIGSA